MSTPIPRQQQSGQKSKKKSKKKSKRKGGNAGSAVVKKLKTNDANALDRFAEIAATQQAADAAAQAAAQQAIQAEEQQAAALVLEQQAAALALEQAALVLEQQAAALALEQAAAVALEAAEQAAVQAADQAAEQAAEQAAAVALEQLAALAAIQQVAALPAVLAAAEQAALPAVLASSIVIDPADQAAVTAAYYARNREIVDFVRTNDGRFAANLIEAMDRLPRVKKRRLDLLLTNDARTSHQAKTALELMTPVEFRTLLLPEFLTTIQLAQLDTERWIPVVQDPDERDVLPTQQIRQRSVSTWGGWKAERQNGQVDEWDPEGQQYRRMNGKHYFTYCILAHLTNNPLYPNVPTHLQCIEGGPYQPCNVALHLLGGKENFRIEHLCKLYHGIIYDFLIVFFNITILTCLLYHGIIYDFLIGFFDCFFQYNYTNLFIKSEKYSTRKH